MYDFKSVSQLGGYINQYLKENPYLNDISVIGEISQ